MKLKAKDGKEAWVRIDSMHVGRTYAGLLQGVPSKDYNDEKLEKFKVEAVKLIGCGPFGKTGELVYGKKAHPIVIAPERKPLTIAGGVERLPEHIRRDVEKAETLPGYCVYVMLEGSATDGKSDGALALIIFFAKDFDRPFKEMVEEACKDEVWEYIAYNYDV
jgi:hypothetical protein